MNIKIFKIVVDKVIIICYNYRQDKGNNNSNNKGE